MNYQIKKVILFPMNVLYRINSKAEIKLLFLLKNGYRLNLKKPVTFNEKIQWIKLYDKDERRPICSDKYEVRDYIRSCGCEELLIPLLWEGFDADQIPFETLPNQFVIKVTHGCGFNIICRDKHSLDQKKTKNKLNHWLKEQYIPCYGEWFYGKVRPRIIIEEFLDDGSGEVPKDYKVNCFNGEPKYIQVHINRFTNHVLKYYDLNWNSLDHVTMIYPNNPKLSLNKPEQLQQLIEYAKRISLPFLLARVDFYIIKERIYFGEITFTDGAGFGRILPRSFEIELGNCLKLPTDQSDYKVHSNRKGGGET